MTIRLFLRSFFFLLIVLSSLLLGSLFYIVQNHVVDFSVLGQYSSGHPSLLLDDEGNVWGSFQLDKRDPIELSAMPKHLVHAFIAAEDWEFFAHHGISWKGIVRSIVVNVYHGRKAQGASTITQQLVKLLFFDAQKTFVRKIKEQLYAVLVELQFTKEQILQTYLNHVCFGCGIYGVEAASQRFWSKHARDLTIDEAATLAGIIRMPARYCPLSYPLAAQKRRDVIVRKMEYLGYISSQDCQDVLSKPLVVHDRTVDSFAPHVKEMLRVYLEDVVGKTQLYLGGLKISTTISKTMQRAAQQVFAQEMLHLQAQLGADIDGGIIVIDRATGEIKAAVGGFDFATSKFNRVTQARRQIGSLIKPLIYAAALEKGLSFFDTYIDEPFELIENNGAWAPNNYDKKFNGQVTLAYALSRSNNIVAIKTFLCVGAAPVIDLAKKCHIIGPYHHYPSLALGTIDATLSEVAGMFNIFANDGVYVSPHTINWVKDRWGTKMVKATYHPQRILPSRLVGQVSSVLSLWGQRREKILGSNNWVACQVLSKTGTTNDSRTCWFIGSTPSLTTAVFVGFDDNRSMGKNVYPIKTAFPIWLAFNRAIESQEKIFSYDSSLKEIVIDEKTGKLSSAEKPGAISILV